MIKYLTNKKKKSIAQFQNVVSHIARKTHSSEIEMVTFEIVR